MIADIKAKYNLYKPIWLYSGLIFFIFSWLMKYSTTEMPLWTFWNYVSMIFIVVVGIFQVSLKKNRYTFAVIGFIILYTLGLTFFGVYHHHVAQIYSYVGGLALFTLMGIVLAEYFHTRLLNFLFVWQIILTVRLGYLALMYTDELNFNMAYFFKSLLINVRFDRVGMGFYNVNILGFFSGILILTSIFQIIHKRYIIFSTTTMIFGFLLLLNTGTRSVLFGIIAVIIGGQLLWFPKIVRKYGWYLFLVLYGLVQTVYGFYMFFANDHSELFLTLRKLSSNRVNLGHQAFQTLTDSGNIWFGTGTRLMSDLREDFFPKWGVTSGLDSDVQWYVFTMGIVGAIIILGAWVFINTKLPKLNNPVLYIAALYFSVVMIFEHVLFYNLGASGSNGAFWTVLIIIMFRMLGESGEPKLPESNMDASTSHIKLTETTPETGLTKRRSARQNFKRGKSIFSRWRTK